MRITVLGAGAWGTALAQVLAENGHETVLWTWLSEHAAAMEQKRENQEFLPGVPFREGLRVTASLQDACEGAELLVVVVPSHAVRGTLGAASQYLPPNISVVCASKGIEEKTLCLMSEVIDQVLGDHEDTGRHIGVISGPSFAKEVARGIPTNLVSASTNEEFAALLQQVFSNSWLRVYTSTDPVGVEVGGALKNVVAIAAGACDGFGLGHNTRAALITRGIAEMARLTIALGGEALTTAGLAGVGDLVLTCTGDLSRNRTLGFKLGQGTSLEDALATSAGVVEGYVTTKSAHELAQRAGVDLPICNAVYDVLYGKKDPTHVLKGLLSRPLRPELG